MKATAHIRLAVTLLCLFAAQVEAREFAFGFSVQRTGEASAPVNSFAIGDTISLSLPDGQPSFSLSIVAAPPAGIAGQSYIARDALSQASAVVKPTKEGLRVTIDDFEHKRLYSVLVKDGVVEAVVRDTSGGGDDVCGTCGGDLASPPPETTPAETTAAEAAPSRASRLKSAMLGAGNVFPVAEQKAVVDILVAFDQGAKTWVEGGGRVSGDTVEEFADYAVSKMNMVLEKSQLNDKFFYRLVGIVEVEASYDVINDNLLNALRLRNSGALAPVGAAREKCGADTITLLIDRDREKSTTSGLGYEYLSNSWSYATFDATGYTCNICDIKTVYERYTMSHETGHNMGCGHSNRQGKSSGPGCNPYSCGYHFEDAAGTKRYTIMAYDNTSPASGTYSPVPYFSSPDITPEDLGVPVGTPTNNNRLTILNNYKDVAAWREHVVPYDWDVRFLDDSGNDIPNGTYFSPSLYVTFTNANPNARIYYTYDGTTPTSSSDYCTPGTRFTFTVTRTITACAVVDGIAQSVRTITFNEGLLWSGESGENGNGVWKDGDSSVLSWNNFTSYFYNSMDAVVFPDLADNASPTVSVCGAVAPTSAAFPAEKTAYTFAKGDNAAQISVRDACFAPSGNLTFNVPVKLDAVAFTNPASHTLTFNAPFGQTLTETSGYCTNMVGIGSAGTLVVAPGAGKTQYFDSLNTEWYFSSARFCVGEGTVVFKGPADSSKGVFGNTGIVVGRGGNLVLDFSGSIAGVYSSIACEGTITFKAVATANSKTWWTDSGWKGTVAFEGLSADTTTQNFQFEKYGNADSRILLRNCAISYLSSNNAVFPGTLVLHGADALRFGGNGYSSNWNVIGALEGDGSISALSQHTQTYVFNTATNYTGSISIGATSSKGRRIVFGSVSAAGDIPSQTATITVKSGAVASIGGGATWNAYHGVEIGGTLLVKGTGATLDCNASAAMGLKLDDGATLRFETADASLVFAKAPQFANGMVNIAFAGGAAPYDGKVLVQWPNGAVPAGDFAFADSASATRWVLSKTATGLVVENSPLPATVMASITARYWGDDGWEDRLFDFDLPTAWITNYYQTLETVEAVVAKYDETAANGARVWQCYMLGLDPTNAASQVSLAMTVAGNEIRFAVEGLGETHALDGIKVEWRMKTSTNLVTDAVFSNTREYKTGLMPAFGAHSMPDTPADPKEVPSTKPADALFYKITVSFVPEDDENDQP